MPMRLFLALPLLIAACGSGNGRIDKDDDDDMGEDAGRSHLITEDLQ